jgi:hypothetical protein
MELIATLASDEHPSLWSVLIDLIAQDTKRHLDLLERKDQSHMPPSSFSTRRR